jgi:hypothetical protein
MNTYPLSPYIDAPLPLVMMKSPQGGNHGDTRRIEMESEMMMSENPIGQDWK